MRFPQAIDYHMNPLPETGGGASIISETDHEDNHHQYRLDREDYLLTRSASDSTAGGGLRNLMAHERFDETMKSPVVVMSEKPTFSAQLSGIAFTLKRAKKLVLHNIALPITFLLYGFVSLSTEVLYTSCCIISNRYFKWSGSYAGSFLALLAALVLPTYLLTSYMSTRFGERVVIKKALLLMMVGIFSFMNYQALFVLFKHVQDIFRQETWDEPLTTYYDWDLGLVQYWTGVIIMFVSSASLEGLSLSLMSKVSPAKLNRSPVNCSVIAPLTSCLGRVLGDTIIVAVGLSHRMVSTDMVNSISFVLLGLCFCCFHVVKKHYFFLNGA